MSRLLKGCQIVENFPEAGARAIGELCGRTGTSDVVDALVVLLAKQISARMMVTSDPGDLSIPRNHTGAQFALRPI